MLKTIKILFISLLLLASTPAFIFADENESETAIAVTTNAQIETTKVGIQNRDEASLRLGHFQNEDERNAYITKTQLGGKIRVLQLKESLEHQSNGANIIIEYLDNKNISTSDLESIAANFEGLILEIEEMSMENKTSEELAKEFVAIKENALELSNEFKTTVSASLTEEEKIELREILKENKENNKKKNQKIKELVQEYNKEKAQELLDKLGIDPRRIAEQIQNGELDPQEIKDRIRMQFADINDSQREKLKVEFREDAQKLKIEARERENELRIEAREKAQELRERLQEKQKDLMELRIKNEELRAEMRIKRDEIEAKIREGDTRFELRKDGETRFRDENGEIRVRSDGTIEIKDRTDEDDDIEEEEENESEEEEDEIK